MFTAPGWLDVIMYHDLSQAHSDLRTTFYDIVFLYETVPTLKRQAVLLLDIFAYFCPIQVRLGPVITPKTSCLPR